MTIESGLVCLQSQEDRCSQAVQSAWKEFAEINIYDVYVDTCVPRGPGQQLGVAARGHPYAFGPYIALNSAPAASCLLASVIVSHLRNELEVSDESVPAASTRSL